MSSMKERVLEAMIAMSPKLSEPCESEVCSALGLYRNSQVGASLRALVKDGVVRVSGSKKTPSGGIGKTFALVEQKAKDAEPKAAEEDRSGTNPFLWRTYKRWEPDKKA